MSQGQLVIHAATMTVGTREVGRNGGKTVQQWQDEAATELHAGYGTYHHEPWCGMSVMHWYRVAGVSHDGIAHPAVSEICRVGEQRKARWTPDQGPIPVGSIYVLQCGVHTGVVLHHGRGDRWITTIEGNTSDMVAVRHQALTNVPGHLRRKRPGIEVYGGFDGGHSALQPGHGDPR